MANKHGNFIWYELNTSDLSAAEAFYGPLLGWRFADSGQPDRAYHLASMNGNNIGGFTPVAEGSSVPPGWIGYIAVSDTDKAATAIKSAGGTIHIPAFDIENVGRLAFVSDPQGAMFYIMHFTPATDNTDSSTMPFANEKPMDGHCAWNELMTSDPDAAMKFYVDQFSWNNDDAPMDMGDAGKYEFFRHDGNMIAGVMKKPEPMPVSKWSYYFRVADIDLAVQQITNSGGQLLADPMEIPGGEFALQGMDSQQIMFALVGPRRST